MEYEKAVVALDILLGKEPANEGLYASALEFCENRVSEQETVDYVESQKRTIQQIKDGESIIAILIHRGGLERILTVDGELYDGSLEELQVDDSISDDAEIESYVQSTQAGLDVARSFRISNSLETLFGEAPQFVPGFTVVLQQCTAEEGKTTNELQDALIAAGIIGPGNTEAQVIHASYFTSKLERYGALVWDRKRWRTTEKGEAVL